MEFYERFNEEQLIAVHYVKTLSIKQLKNLGVFENSKNEEDRTTQFKYIKNYCDGIIKSNGEIKRLYKFTGSLGWGINGEGSGRLFCGNSIQGIKKDIRGLLLKGFTTDIDMKNAHPVLLRYICNINGVPCPHLEYYINHRDDILSQFNSRDEGKKLFLKATNYDKINKKEKNLIFKDYDKEMKTIQTNITGLEKYKDIVAEVPETKHHNWNGSAINRILCYYENKVLQIMIEELNRMNIEIMTPMFDGLVAYGIHNDTLLRRLETKINAEFPNMNMELTIKEHSTKIVVPEDFEIPKKRDEIEMNIAGDDNEATDILFDAIKKELISYKSRLFFKKENIWIDVIETIDANILRFIMNSKIYYGYDEEKEKPIPYAQNVGTAKRLREALYAKIKIDNEDCELYYKFHSTTKGKICFKDGVLDFPSQSFTLWENIEPNTIYSTMMINRNFGEYFNNPNNEIIQDIKSKIYENLYGDKTDTALHFLSRAIAGHNEDKVWGTYLGNRNCGKSLEYDLEKAGFGDYVGSFELSNMLYSRKTAGMENLDSRRLYWTMDFEWIRLAVSQEIPDDKSGLILNGKILKKLSGGGDEMTARRNYDRFDIKFYTQATLFMKGNNQVITDTPDCNETRVQFSSLTQFKSQQEINEMRTQPDIFTEEEMKRYKVKDDTIKDKCKTLDYANAVVYLIFQNYKSYPVHIENDVEIQGNNLLMNIYEKFIITNNKEDVLTIEYVNSSLCDFDKGKIKLELLNLGVFKKKATGGPNKNKTCFFGIKDKQLDKQDADIL